MTLRFPVAPMKATMGSTGAVPDGDEWAFEIKWDGYRTIVHIADGRVRLQSTAGHDVTDRWPEFADLAGAVNARSAILDGELVVFDDDGRPRFDLVQRSGVGSDRQAVIQFFDVLQIDGNDTIDLPYIDRRRLLDQLIEPGDNWTVPSYRIGDGADAAGGDRRTGPGGCDREADRLSLSTRHPNEGLAQDQEPHLGRVDDRRLHRRHRQPIRHVRRAAGRTTAHPRGWQFAGGVGTGFDQRTLRTLTDQLRELATDECPFEPSPPASVARTATWVEPVLRAKIEIAEFTNDGLVRHATFISLID